MRQIIGLDLGQSNDFTAIVVLEHHNPPRTGGNTLAWMMSMESLAGQPESATVRHMRDAQAQPQTPEQLHVVHLERIRQQPYPVIADRVLTLFNALKKRGSVDLVVDNTGVGRAVVDLLANANPVRINIHGGQAVTGDARVFGVPKKDLVASVVTAFEGGTLKIADGLELGPVLAQEALRLEARIKSNGHVELAADWRERDHDDLVLALACGLWWAHKPKKPLPSLYFG